MKKGLFRCFQSKKELIDKLISSQRGDFDKRTPRDLRDVFKLDFRKASELAPFSIPESSTERLSHDQQDFLKNLIAAYNSTLPSPHKLSKSFEAYSGADTYKHSLIETFLRGVVIVGYQEGVEVHKNYRVNLPGNKEGHSEYVITLADVPRLVTRVAVKKDWRIRGTPLEFAFCSVVFEMYSHFWENPMWPIVGVISDVNSWIFLKYDGEEFSMSQKVYKLALHDTAIYSLGIKFLNVLDSIK